MTFSLPSPAALLSAVGGISGIVGMILGAVNAGSLPPNLRDIVTAIAGVMVIISHNHVTRKATHAIPTALVAAPATGTTQP